MPSPGQSALKFLRSNLRRGAKPKVRIAVLGQASVGKTALIVRYVTKRFIYDYAPEIAKVYQHQTVLDQEEVNMEIWDTAGHFNSSAELRHLEVFVRWADVVVLVYSITDRASFNLALQLMETISQIRPRQQQQQQQQIEQRQQQQQQQPQSQFLNAQMKGGEHSSSSPSFNARPKEIPLLERNNSTPANSKDPLKNSFEFCEHCPDFPVLLVGTKCDLWRDRQIRVETGMQICQQFGCANFKEISTKESIDEVGDVFEVALRQGWLYRQHRELTKHRTLTLYPSSSSPAFEKSNSIDNGSIDWLENQPPGNLMPPSPNSYLGNLSPTSSNGSAVGSFSSDGRKLLNLTANASSSTSMGACSTTAVVTLANSSASSASCSSVNETTRKKLSPIGPSTFKCQSLISNIKKCITPAGRPMFHSLPSQNYLAPPGPSGLTSTMGVADFDGIIIEEHPNNPTRKLFRSRANTDSRLCSRSRSMSMGANMNPFFTIGNETIDNKDDTWKPKRKTSVFFP